MLQRCKKWGRRSESLKTVVLLDRTISNHSYWSMQKNRLPLLSTLPSGKCESQAGFLLNGEKGSSYRCSLYKGNSSRTSCRSYRPICLLSVPGKVFARVQFDHDTSSPVDYESTPTAIDWCNSSSATLIWVTSARSLINHWMMRIARYRYSFRLGRPLSIMESIAL